MNMSRSNLHIRSKALFGVSAHEFIKTVRFNEASAFRKFLGCTPTEYVRKNAPQA